MRRRRFVSRKRGVSRKRLSRGRRGRRLRKYGVSRGGIRL